MKKVVAAVALAGWLMMSVSGLGEAHGGSYTIPVGTDESTSGASQFPGLFTETLHGNTVSQIYLKFQAGNIQIGDIVDQARLAMSLFDTSVNIADKSQIHLSVYFCADDNWRAPITFGEQMPGGGLYPSPQNKLSELIVIDGVDLGWVFFDLMQFGKDVVRHELTDGYFSLIVRAEGLSGASQVAQFYGNTYYADTKRPYLDIETHSPAPVPAPGAALLLVSGLLGLAGLRRKKKTAVA